MPQPFAQYFTESCKFVFVVATIYKLFPFILGVDIWRRGPLQHFGPLRSRHGEGQGREEVQEEVKVELEIKVKFRRGYQL